MADIFEKLTMGNVSANAISNLGTHANWQKIWSLLRPWPYYVLPAIMAYPFLCTALRSRRIKAMQAKYKYGTPEHPSFEDMTVKEAHEIMMQVSDVEFPALYTMAMQFALFRTYGIPTISELLVKTTQLSASKNVGKRYADTGVLLTDIYASNPDEKVAYEAYGRLNYLHGHYIKQGKITNDDMLYTLSLFLNQPAEWINKYEWRQFTDLEYCAQGVFHKSMGDRMEISFESLPGYTTGWKDGLQFYHELEDWAKEYEKEHMVPHKNNYDTAVQTRNILMATSPKFMHGFLTKLVSVPLDDRLREAVMFDEAPATYTYCFQKFMDIRRIYLRYFALPRPRFMIKKMVTKIPDTNGRRYYVTWDTVPTYVKPTLWNRWGPGAMISWLMGMPLPGDHNMYPEGFVVKDVGPKAFVGNGSKEAAATVQKLEKEPNVGCPFAIRRA